MVAEEKQFTMRGDRPIESADEDRLGRTPFAKAIAEQVLLSPALDSFVVAIAGPWGSGKTSLINLLTEEITLRSDAVVLRFNPWIFSGAEQLVTHFFRELGAQCEELNNEKLSSVGAALQKYAGWFGSVATFLPAVGNTLKGAADAVKGTGEALASPPSLHSQRTMLREQLLKMGRRVVVLIDDIDRLTAGEVRELMKLVRLTGDFPNIVYVLAFDRQRVEVALGDTAEDGRAYLEKIVQVTFDVPRMHDADLYTLLTDELNAAIQGREHGHYSNAEFLDLLVSVVRPLVRSPRDVRRYVNALVPTIKVVGREVSLTDVLVLEAIRAFVPAVFARLPAFIDVLTAPASSYSRSDQGEATRLQALVSAAGEHSDPVREFIFRLFPHGARHLGGTQYSDGYRRQWSRTRRVALPEVFRFYLEHRLPPEAVRTADVERVYALLGDRPRLTELLDTFESRRLEALFARLEVFEGEYPEEHVESAVGAMLDQVGHLRDGREALLDLGSDLALGRVVLRLLRRIEALQEREALIQRVLPSLRWMSGRQALIESASIKGHELASEGAIKAWTEALHAEVAAGPAAKLRGERKAGRLVVNAIKSGPLHAASAQALLNDDDAFISFLTSFLSEQRSQQIDSAVTHSEDRLPWQWLGEVLGSPWLRDRVITVAEKFDATQFDRRAQRAISLGAQYASGWAPKDDFAEDEDE